MGDKRADVFAVGTSVDHGWLWEAGDVDFRQGVMGRIW